MLRIIKRIAVVLVIGGMASCANNEASTTDSIQTVEHVSDTNHLITDSVSVPDTTTADIDAMKKRN